MMKSAIQARGLRRTFASRRGEVEAVAGIDLDVARGAIFGFLGPNGAGKTTTLRMLTTLLPPRRALAPSLASIFAPNLTRFVSGSAMLDRPVAPTTVSPGGLNWSSNPVSTGCLPAKPAAGQLNC